MTTVLVYEDLDTKRIDPVFSKDGQLLVSLPIAHAAALISFIEAVRESQSWGPKRIPVISRLLPLAKALLVTLRVTVMHSRLFALGQIIVLNSSSQTWEQLPNGQVLFRFVR